MRVVIDWKAMAQGLGAQVQRLEAVRLTVRNTGVGEVLVSGRKKLPHERGKTVLHGSKIANLLRQIGHDPFNYPEPVLREAEGFLALILNRVIQKSWSEQRDCSAEINIALGAQAEELAAWAAENLASGGLGQSVGKYGKSKAIAANLGRRGATKKYGSPPPVGVYSGRFLEGIRSRLRSRRRNPDA